MHNFKKRIFGLGRCCLFFAILILLLYGLSMMIENALVNQDTAVQARNKSRFRIRREPADTVDMLIVGDSLSYTAFSPMELWEKEGISSFVCGQSGQKIQETYTMLLTAFENQSPKLVVLESNVLFRGKPGLAGIQETLEAFGNQYLPIVRGHDVWKTWLIDKKYEEQSFKGFTFRSVISSYKGKNISYSNKKPTVITDLTLDYMKKINKLCEEHGAKLLLVSVPSPVNYSIKRLQVIREMTADLEIDYVDLNSMDTDLAINWVTDTADKGDHLNFLGAQKVSRFMASYVERTYGLSDHRSDPAYKGWNDMAQVYAVEAKKQLDSMEKKIEGK